MAKKLIMTSAALLLVCLTTACASKPPIKYRLDCRANQSYEQCGKVFDSEYECKAAQNEMIRGEASQRERGTCLRD